MRAKEILKKNLKSYQNGKKRSQEYLKRRLWRGSPSWGRRKGRQEARMKLQNLKSQTEDQASESDQDRNQLRRVWRKSRRVRRGQRSIKESKSEPKKQDKQDKNRKKSCKGKTVKPKFRSSYLAGYLDFVSQSLNFIGCLLAYLLSPYATMKDIRVEGTVQTTADDIRQASGIQDSDIRLTFC